MEQTWGVHMGWTPNVLICGLKASEGMGGASWGPSSLVHKGCFHLWKTFRVQPHSIFHSMTLYEVQMENKMTKSPSKVAKLVKEVCRKKTLPSKEWRLYPHLWPISLVGRTDLHCIALHFMNKKRIYWLWNYYLYEVSFNVHLIILYLWIFGGILGWG